MPQLEHIEAIEKRLWTAADTLRANSNYASNVAGSCCAVNQLLKSVVPAIGTLRCVGAGSG
jgi:hypothetical protein